MKLTLISVNIRPRRTYTATALISTCKVETESKINTEQWVCSPDFLPFHEAVYCFRTRKGDGTYTNEYGGLEVWDQAQEKHQEPENTSKRVLDMGLNPQFLSWLQDQGWAGHGPT